MSTTIFTWPAWDANVFRKLIDLPPTARPRGLTWSRDGSEVLVALHEATSDIVLYDVER